MWTWGGARQLRPSAGLSQENRAALYSRGSQTMGLGNNQINLPPPGILEAANRGE